MPTVEQLINLLQSQDKGLLTDFCLNALIDRSVVISSTKPVPIQDTRTIFRTRARINEKLNQGIIKGFDELIIGLDTFKNSHVVISSVRDTEGDYKIFSNESGTEFAGILLIPLSKDTP